MMEADGERGFMLFSCCIPVKGAVRSVVCDLQRADYVFISNELYGLLKEGKFLGIKEIQNEMNVADGVELQSQLEFLQEKEFGFWCSKSESGTFPAIEFQTDIPKKIAHAIIDSDISSEHPFDRIFKQLSKLGCQAVQLRFFDPIEVKKVENVLAMSQDNGFTDVELIMPTVGVENIEIGRSLSQKFPVLTKLIFHSEIYNRLLSKELEECPIYQITNKIISEDHCGFIHPDGFVVGYEMFSEAQRSNSCLNRKLSIDKNGNVRNCPAMPGLFGKIWNADLDLVVEDKEFTKVWNLSKDAIKVCKDCEFRYICMDCRAFVSDTNDKLSKPLRCSYDPYSAEWQND